MKKFLVLQCLFLFCIAGFAMAQDPVTKGQAGKAGGVTSIEDRLKTLEESTWREVPGDKWYDRIQISGLIEAEAGYSDIDSADPQVDGATSDIALATVELAADAEIAPHVSGHLIFLWEEDDTEPVDIDEGFIILDGGDMLPLFLNAGKMYVPFGYFESHFITDPLTLELGETRESAVHVGFTNDMLDLSVAAFNGDVQEIGDDDHIDDWVANAQWRLPQESIPGFGLVIGTSYISNIAESDALTEAPPLRSGRLCGWHGRFSEFFLGGPAACGCGICRRARRIRGRRNL